MECFCARLPTTRGNKQLDAVLTGAALCVGGFRYMTVFWRCAGKLNLVESAHFDHFIKAILKMDLTNFSKFD